MKAKDRPLHWTRPSVLGEWWARSLLTPDTGENRRGDAVNTERSGDTGMGTGCGGREQFFSQRERLQHVSVLIGELHEQTATATGGLGAEELPAMSPSRSGQASRGGIQCMRRRRASRGAGAQHEGEAPRLGSWATPVALCTRDTPDTQGVPPAVLNCGTEQWKVTGGRSPHFQLSLGIISNRRRKVNTADKTRTGANVAMKASGCN